ncbi:Uncharacterised protein r2_g4341 [Pycnogonum litorale]
MSCRHNRSSRPDGPIQGSEHLVVPFKVTRNRSLHQRSCTIEGLFHSLTQGPVEGSQHLDAPLKVSHNRCYMVIHICKSPFQTRKVQCITSCMREGGHFLHIEY